MVPLWQFVGRFGRLRPSSAPAAPRPLPQDTKKTHFHACSSTRTASNAAGGAHVAVSSSPLWRCLNRCISQLRHKASCPAAGAGYTRPSQGGLPPDPTGSASRCRGTTGVKTKATSAAVGGLVSPSLKTCASGAMVSAPKSGLPTPAPAGGGCLPFLDLRRSEDVFLAFLAAAEPPPKLMWAARPIAARRSAHTQPHRRFVGGCDSHTISNKLRFMV
jgi:hypothetical protein